MFVIRCKICSDKHIILAVLWENTTVRLHKATSFSYGTQRFRSPQGLKHLVN